MSHDDEGEYISEGTEFPVTDDCCTKRTDCRCRRCIPGRLNPVCQPVRPYFQRHQTCREDSAQRTVERVYSQVLKTSQSFAMPGCGLRIRVVFDSVADIANNAWLWAYGYGFLKIVSYNCAASDIELENPCPVNVCQDQAAPGTSIPVGTTWVLTPPPCPNGTASQNNLFPYLAAGFTAPVVGACIDIKVTTVNGISVNKSVTLNNGVYRVSAIIDATTITICNDGAGLVAGVPVEYKDSSGIFIVPVVLIDSNPCLNDSVPSGVVMVCKNGTMVPIAPTADNQVLVGDLETSEADYRTLGIPTLNCTPLTVSLTLDPALPSGTAYLVQVQDTSDYTVGEIVLIAGTQFTVSAIDSSTEMHIIPVEDPSAIQTYNVGATLCSADCCTLLDARLDVLENAVGAYIAALSAENDAAAITAPTVLNGAAPTLVGNIAEVTITNPSTVFDMQVHGTCIYDYVYHLIGAEGNDQDIGRFVELIRSTNPAGVPVQIYDLPETLSFRTVTGATTVNRFSFQASHNFAFTLAPGETTVVRTRATMSWNAGEATRLDVYILGSRISYLGVAAPHP